MDETAERVSASAYKQGRSTSRRKVCCYEPNTTHYRCYLKALADFHTRKIVGTDHLINSAIEHSRGLSEYINSSHVIKCLVINKWMHWRHDTLFRILVESLGITYTGTDVSFRKFGINSDKTPDLIFEKDGVLNIIEVTVVNILASGYIKKGSSERMMQSKYKSEIDALTNERKVVREYIVVFDVGREKSDDYLFKAKLIATDLGMTADFSDLTTMLDHFRNMQDFIKRHYSSSIEDVLTIKEAEKVAVNFDCDIDGLYHDKFAGEYFYHKGALPSTTLAWLNTSEMLYSKSMGHSRYLLNYDRVTRLNKFITDRDGLTKNEWLEAIKANDHKKICDHFYLTRDGKRLSTSEVSIDESIMLFDHIKVDEHFEIGLPEKETDHHYFKVMEPVDEYKYDKNELMIISRYDDSGVVEEIKECIYHDPTYESKVINSVKNFFDLSIANGAVLNGEHMPLCNANMELDNIMIAQEELSESMEALNTEKHNVLRKNKPPFQYPVVKVNMLNKCSLKDKNPEFLEEIKDHMGPYCKEVIRLALANNNMILGPDVGDKKAEFESIKHRVAELSRELNLILRAKQLHEKPSAYKSFCELWGAQDFSAENISKLKKNLGTYRKTLMSKRHNRVLIDSRKSMTDFQNEMSHFKKSHKARKNAKQHSAEQAVTEGSLDNFRLSYQRIYDKMIEEMMSDDMPMYETFDSLVTDDCKLMTDLKNMYNKRVTEHYNFFKSKRMYNSLCFISNLCKTLMYHSQTSDNHNYVTLDNLGFSDCMLFIRGGNKIFKTKSSKLFRLVFPAYDFYKEMVQGNNNYTFVKTQHGHLCITPWMNMHETLLAEGMSMVSRHTSFFCASGLQLNITPDEVFKHTQVHHILGMHARRQTEVFMHQLRYVLVSMFAKKSKIQELIKEFAGVNYDFIQSFFRYKFCDNLATFASKAMKKEPEFENIFTGIPLNTADQKSYFIYSTYLMPKAPYNQAIEQSKNLVNVLKIVSEWSSKVGAYTFSEQHKVSHVENTGDALSHWNQLFKHDYMYDGKMCYNTGKFISGYLMAKTTKEELEVKWRKCLNKKYTSMATTKGLRGYGEDKFGRKGYFIIYKELLEDEEYVNKVWEFIDALKDEQVDYLDMIVKIKEFNITFRDKMREKPLTEIIAHVVDKVQRGGAREIYVFSQIDKLYQMPAEEFLSHLCSLVDNEMISVPSNRRLHKLHTSLFERTIGGDTKTTYLSLDCRKWAPKSVLNRFIAFIEGLKDCLPIEVYKIIKKFFSLKYKQKVITRKKIYSILENNQNEAIKQLKSLMQPTGEAAEFIMSFSFIMGHWNYLTSLQHAASQLYVQYILNKVKTVYPYKGNDCIAYGKNSIDVHSDDSGGKIEVRKSSMKHENGRKYHDIYTDLIYWLMEYIMKCGNMLYSDKKCIASKTYFELLSILYIDKKLVSMNPKFLAGCIYKPTDKGPIHDMMTVYSKATECISYGSTFEQAYCIMKFMAHEIWRFYYNCEPTINDYKRPVQCFGMPDAHPLMLLLSGSSSDLVRLFYKLGDHMSDLINSHNSWVDSPEIKGGVQILSCTPHIQLKYKPFRKYTFDAVTKMNELDDKNFQFIIKNTPTQSSLIDMIKFAYMLRNPGFIGAMQDESTSRMISRSFFYRDSYSIYLNKNNYKPSEILQIYRGFTLNGYFSTGYKLTDDAKVSEKMIKLLHAESIKFTEYCDNQSCTDAGYSATLTTKPCYFNIKKFYSPIKIDSPPIDVALYLSADNKYRCFINDIRYVMADADQARQLLSMKGFSNLDLAELTSFIEKFTKKEEASYYLYSTVESTNRQITKFGSIMGMLATNSIQGKILTGFNVRYNEYLTSSDKRTHIFDTPDAMQTYAILNMIEIINSSKDVGNWRFHKPDFIEYDGTEMDKDLILEKLEDHWKLQSVHYALMKHHFQIAKMDQTDSIDMSYFYTFIRPQIKRGALWVGYGELLIKVMDKFLLLTLNGKEVTEMTSTLGLGVVTDADIEYINACLSNEGLNDISYSMSSYALSPETITFGIDSTGFYRVGKVSELVKYFPSYRSVYFMITPTLGDIKTWQVRHSAGKYYLQKHIEAKTVQYRVKIIEPQPADLVDLYKKVVSHIDYPEGAKYGSSMIEAVNRLLTGTKGVTAVYNKDQVINNFKATKLYGIMYNSAMKGFTPASSMSPPTFDENEPTFYNILDRAGLIDKPEAADVEALGLSARGSLPWIAAHEITKLANKVVPSNMRKKIVNEIQAMYKVMATGSLNEKAIKLMKKYGYGAVLGSVATDLGKKDETMFRHMSLQREFRPYASKSYWVIHKAISRTLMSNYANYKIKPLVFMTRQLRENRHVVLHLAHWIHLSMMEREKYQSDSVDFSVLSVGGVFFSCALNYIFSQDSLMDYFEGVLQEDPFLRQLPLGPDEVVNWVAMYNSMKLNEVQNLAEKDFDAAVYSQMCDDFGIGKTRKLPEFTPPVIQVDEDYWGELPTEEFHGLKPYCDISMFEPNEYIRIDALDNPDAEEFFDDCGLNESFEERESEKEDYISTDRKLGVVISAAKLDMSISYILPWLGTHKVITTSCIEKGLSVYQPETTKHMMEVYIISFPSEVPDKVEELLDARKVELGEIEDCFNHVNYQGDVTAKAVSAYGYAFRSFTKTKSMLDELKLKHKKLSERLNKIIDPDSMIQDALKVMASFSEDAKAYFQKLIDEHKSKISFNIKEELAELEQMKSSIEKMEKEVEDTRVKKEKERKKVIKSYDGGGKTKKKGKEKKIEKELVTEEDLAMQKKIKANLDNLGLKFERSNLFELARVHIERGNLDSDKVTKDLDDVAKSVTDRDTIRRMYELPEIFDRARAEFKATMGIKDKQLVSELNAVHPMLNAAIYYISERRKKTLRNALLCAEARCSPDQRAYCKFVRLIVSSAKVADRCDDWDPVWVDFTDSLMDLTNPDTGEEAFEYTEPETILISTLKAD